MKSLISVMNFSVMNLIVCLSVIGNGPIWAGNLVENGNFTTFENFKHLTQRFNDIKPTGWLGGDKLTYITSTYAATVVDNNGGLSVWASPGESPSGGYFVMASADQTTYSDGSLAFSDTFYQTINNLTIGKLYELGFYQAGGTNVQSSVATVQQWKVGFGDQYVSSDVMSAPAKGVTAWQKQTMHFIADATTINLSFLAFGSPSTTEGVPPVAFLDGIYIIAIPDPNSLLLSGLGFVGLNAFGFWRKKK